MSSQFWAIETRSISYSKKLLVEYERQKEDDSLGKEAVAIIDLE
jgi:hypothetical protein